MLRSSNRQKTPPSTNNGGADDPNITNGRGKSESPSQTNLSNGDVTHSRDRTQSREGQNGDAQNGGAHITKQVQLKNDTSVKNTEDNAKDSESKGKLNENNNVPGTESSETGEKDSLVSMVKVSSKQLIEEQIIGNSYGVMNDDADNDAKKGGQNESQTADSDKNSDTKQTNNDTKQVINDDEKTKNATKQDSAGNDGETNENKKSKSDTKADEKNVLKAKNERPTDPLAEKYKRLRKLSDEEALVKMKWVIDQLKQQQEYDTLETKYIMMLVSGMYFDYKLLRHQIADVMLKEGYPELSLKILKEYNKLGLFKSDEIWFPAYYILNSWWNYSDASMELGQALAENGVVSLLTTTCSHEPFLANYTTSKNVCYLLKSSLSILHNLARVGTLKHVFDENKTSEVISIFLNSEDEMFKILTNLTIAHIADDDTNKKQILGPETIECIIKWTESALDSKTKRKRGFCAYELVDGLNRLAVNDSNKMTIVDKGVIPVATRMMSEDDVNNQSSVCRLLWTLTFDKNVRQKIKDDSALMETLEGLKDSPEARVKKNATGALWVIKGENDVTTQHRPQTAPAKQHVMLSYSWSDKEIVLRIKDALKAAGYPVWIDVESMGGSTLEAMAGAIEQASVVLLCMSEKYKNSPNCRTEAEYTFQLRKNYVPLMMQKKYKPDGWLGIILGAKLFFDFSGKYPFERPFNGLLKELHSVGEDRPNDKPLNPIDEADGAITATAAPSTYTQPRTRHQSIASTRSSLHGMGLPEVTAWLQNEAKLSSCLSQFQKFKIDGKLLSQLVVMRSEAPEFFYQCLEKRLDMDLTEILQFTSALDEAST